MCGLSKASLSKVFVDGAERRARTQKNDGQSTRDGLGRAVTARLCLPSKAAYTRETCKTWPELILKLVGICVKLVKLVKLGRKISKGLFSSKFHEFHEFHEFHANTNEFQDEFWPSFTSFACLCEGSRLQTLAGCARVWAEQGKSLQSLSHADKETVRSVGRGRKKTMDSLRERLKP